MRKVAINICFGGFSLGALAQKRYYELTHPNETYFIYYMKYEESLPIYIEHYILAKSDDDLKENWDNIKIVKNNVGDEFYMPIIDKDFIINKKNLYTLKNFSIEELNKIYDDFEKLDFGGEIEYVDVHEIERHDLNLIKVIEELKESSNGCFSEISLVEIPDNERYIIEEYDGMESIELESECHNKNWK